MKVRRMGSIKKSKGKIVKISLFDFQSGVGWIKLYDNKK